MATQRCRIHKYFRTEMFGTKLWACANCTHYMPKHIEALVPNKPSICWSCDNEMRIGPLQLERDKPICDKCMGIDTEPEISPALMELMKQKGLM